VLAGAAADDQRPAVVDRGPRLERFEHELDLGVVVLPGVEDVVDVGALGVEVFAHHAVVGERFL